MFRFSKLRPDASYISARHLAGRAMVQAAWKTMAGLSFAIFPVFSVHAMGMVDTEPPSAWRYSGWACDPSIPGKQTEVHARRDDGQFLGRVIADRPRHSAIPSDCGSPHGEHGFQLDVARKPEWADGKTHHVTLYSVDRAGNSAPFHTFTTLFAAAPADVVEPPRYLGDIVGRDLASDIDIAKPLGHLGVWDGEMVVEVLNEGKGTKVFRKTWDDFKSRSTTWNTAHPRYPGHMIQTCWNEKCDVNSNRPGEARVSAQMAVVRRAQQVHKIGAEYTLITVFRTVEPEMFDYTSPGWKRKAIWGKYRSDAFIFDAFRASTDIDNSGIFPYRQVFNMPDEWRNKVYGMYYLSVILPYKMMEKIRGL